MTDRFLSAADAQRAWEIFQKLSRHDISAWALAGGLAVEIHCLRGGLPNSARALNDLDFVALSFDCIPATLARDFLFRHVHPLDPPGKTMMQFVDSETALRVDVFRAHGAMMTRTVAAELASGPIQLISAEDVLARAARVLIDLRRGIPVPARHGNDYLRLDKLTTPSDVERAWQDHRKPGQPLSFREAHTLVRDLLAAHRDLLVFPEYCKDATRTCPRCLATAEFPLADPHRVLSLLGYC